MPLCMLFPRLEQSHSPSSPTPSGHPPAPHLLAFGSQFQGHLLSTCLPLRGPAHKRSAFGFVIVCPLVWSLFPLSTGPGFSRPLGSLVGVPQGVPSGASVASSFPPSLAPREDTSFLCFSGSHLLLEPGQTVNPGGRGNPGRCGLRQEAGTPPCLRLAPEATRSPA